MRRSFCLLVGSQCCREVLGYCLQELNDHSAEGFKRWPTDSNKRTRPKICINFTKRDEVGVEAYPLKFWVIIFVCLELKVMGLRYHTSPLIVL